MKRRVSVVIIPVQDMNRAIKFYGDIGLELKFETPGYTEFKTDGAVLALEKREIKQISSGPTFAIQTKNIDKDLKLFKKPLCIQPIAHRSF